MEDTQLESTGQVEVTQVDSTPQVEDSQPTQAQEIPKAETPAPELTLREKIEKKAKEVAEKAAKDPKLALKGTPPALKTGAPGAVKDPNSTSETPPTGEPKEGETAKFEPDFKYKVMDKEHEIPPLLREAMKDPESAKAIREIMEKATGLDYIKPKFQEARDFGKQVSENFNALNGQVRQAKELYSSGDMDGFFKLLQIPEERVLQWLAGKVEYNQLPADQKQMVDAQRQAEERARQAEAHAASYQQSHEQILSQQVQMALDSELAKPDVKQVADAYEARLGKPGAFLDEVRRRGDYHWRMTGQLVAPAKVIQELMGFMGPVAPAAQTATPAGLATTAAAPAAQATQAKPSVIPNISGRSASPVKNQVTSIADLKNRYKEMQSQQD